MRIRYFIFSLLLLFSYTTFFASQVAGHVIPTVTHKVIIDIQPTNSTLKLSYFYDPIIVNRFVKDFDPNSDGQISKPEQDELVSRYMRDFSVQVDEKTIALSEIAATFPSYNDLTNLGQPLEISSKLPVTFDCTSTKVLTIADKNVFMSVQDDIYTFLVNRSGCISVKTVQGNTANESITFVGNVSENSSVSSVKTDKPKIDSSTQKRISEITSVLSNTKIGDTLFLWGIVISFILGALHALTPGHGKTLVAAYLVGQHGTKKDAFILSVVTTITHTASIYILGLISIFATKYFLPEKIIPGLEALSALSIFGLGIWLFSRRLDEFKHSQAHLHAHDHEHSHDDHHHSHEGSDHIHTISDLRGRKVTLGSLISLGFSGGIVPCVDALAVMIVAIGMNKIVLGMVLIFFFSLGLATVLVALGVLLVTSRRLFSRFAPSHTISHLLPLISAGIITLIGVGLVLNVLKIF